jgi:hypothetical protein
MIRESVSWHKPHPSEHTLLTYDHAKPYPRLGP